MSIRSIAPFLALTLCAACLSTRTDGEERVHQDNFTDEQVQEGCPCGQSLLQDQRTSDQVTKEFSRLETYLSKSDEQLKKELLKGSLQMDYGIIFDSSAEMTKESLQTVRNKMAQTLAEKKDKFMSEHRSDIHLSQTALEKWSDCVDHWIVDYLSKDTAFLTIKRAPEDVKSSTTSTEFEKLIVDFKSPVGYAGELPTFKKVRSYGASNAESIETDLAVGSRITHTEFTVQRADPSKSVAVEIETSNWGAVAIILPPVHVHPPIATITEVKISAPPFNFESARTEWKGEWGKSPYHATASPGLYSDGIHILIRPISTDPKRSYGIRRLRPDGSQDRWFSIGNELEWSDTSPELSPLQPHTYEVIEYEPDPEGRYGKARDANGLINRTISTVSGSKGLPESR